jgi:acetolactate synthase I/II/III large subunit
LWELQQVVPADTIYALETGHSLFTATHYLRIDHPDSFVTLMGLASMGASLGLAIGAKLARPERTVIALCGDGGFHMAAGEIATAAAQRLPILVVVLNDGRLGMVEAGNVAIFGRTPDYSTGPLDICRLAEASGAASLRVDAPGDLLRLRLADLPMDRPFVIDARVDRTVPAPITAHLAKRRQPLAAKNLN